MNTNIKENSIINSLKRLDRIGDNNSETLKKIKEAAVEAGEYIVSHDLLKYFPGFTVYGKTLIDEHGKAIDMNMSRETALDFSRDIFKANISGVVINGKRHEG